MRKRTSNPKDFGKVAVLMGEWRRFASTARRRRERPAKEGRAGAGIKRPQSRQGWYCQAARGAAHA